ncbi:hypothetical protein KUA25_04595 [Bacteroidales bacterium MSK.15.36]|nr:hypothetical protein [Bacteroidales bacterium MSK.15.36]
MKLTLQFKGTEELSRKLLQKNSIAWKNVANKSLAEMHNRGAHPPGTPVDSGELRLSRKTTKANSGKSFSGQFGYTKDYGPHVEYGHRTRGGGYVQGQYYLKNNVDAQRKIYRNDLLTELRR